MIPRRFGRYGGGWRPQEIPAGTAPAAPVVRTPPSIPPDQQSQVRGEPRTYGAAERREVLLARERREAAALEREHCGQRVYAWAASLSNEHDRLVAAKAAEVVLDPTR